MEGQDRLRNMIEEMETKKVRKRLCGCGRISWWGSNLGGWERRGGGVRGGVNTPEVCHYCIVAALGSSVFASIWCQELMWVLSGVLLCLRPALHTRVE